MNRKQTSKKINEQSTCVTAWTCLTTLKFKWKMNTKIQMKKTMKKQWQEWKQNPNETEHETHYCINVNPTEKKTWKHENTSTFLQEHEVLQILGTSCFPTNKLQFFVHLLDDVICSFSNCVSFGFRFFIFQKRGTTTLCGLGQHGHSRFNQLKCGDSAVMLRRDKI